MRCNSCGRENMTGTAITCACGIERCPYCFKSYTEDHHCSAEQNILTPFWEDKL